MARGASGLKVLAMVVGLLLMVPDTMQLRVNHPLHGELENATFQPYFLLLLISSSRDMSALVKSGYFVPNPLAPSILISGRTVYPGLFQSVPALVAFHGQPMAAVGATVQLIVDAFKIRGIICYGGAGAVGKDVTLGNVVVPDSVAFSGVWTWEAFKPSSLKQDKSDLPKLKIGGYNLPQAGDNSLDSIQYRTATSYSPNGAQEQTFWHPVDPHWLQIASTIKGVNSEVIHGAKLASSDIYISNKAYADYLRDILDVDIVDTASAAVVQTAKANALPHIVFRGASIAPGQEVDPQLGDQVAKNVLEVVAEFISRLQSTTSSASL